MKTTQEIKEALYKKYDGRVEKIDGYDYIPWPDAQRQADAVFDPDGYNVEVLKTWTESVPNAKGELSFGYAALIRVTVRTTDGTSFYRDNLGFSEVVFTKEKTYPDKQTGEMIVVPARALIDGAIKGCVSRALVRALVLFGEAFGLEMYDKAEDTQAKTGAVSSNTSYNQSSGGGSDKRPSEKQENIFTTKLGFRAEQVNKMPFSLWKPILDDYFGKMNPPDIRNKYAAQLLQLGIGTPKGDGLPIPA